ncbi:ferric reductase transmembrane component 4 like protein [Zymoseptoria brevis]|uniref:Ferric reductase transmembrane component 4 like protein n=1 Tax=Zymoseptoria brevis TaxID=1047168 RepID=A0A0F4GLB0_9PEZI|nr:ferric reductase transmembrane component 4 like protein [Zymoseptoria brevis]
MYKPPCAFACRDAFAGYMLECSTDASPHHSKRMSMGSMSGMLTTPECYATDDAFLQSMAYCISTHCSDIPIWRLEKWWATRLTGRGANLPQPRQAYSATLAHVTTPPNSTIAKGGFLNQTGLVDEHVWLANFNADHIFEVNEINHVTWGLILLITGACIPIVASLLRLLPLPRTFISGFYAKFIDPPAFGFSHRVPWFNTFVMPTRGQAIFIAYLWFINIIACSVGYEVRNPMAWYDGAPTPQIAHEIANRTGIISFANLPLLLLFAGRNNILLWVTDWSHSTYLLVHRWIAVIATLEACVHSAMYLQIYLAKGVAAHNAEAKLPYWIWGVVATLGAVVLIPASMLTVRQKMYNYFIAWHVHHWGYETWIYIAFAVWSFDRFLRAARLARNGIRTARVSIIDEDYIQLDVPGVAAAEGTAYLYFPTLTSPPGDAKIIESTATAIRSEDEKANLSIPHSDPSQVRSAQTPSLTFFIHTSSTGMTSLLRHRHNLPVLVEATYATANIFSGSDIDLSHSSRVVYIAGGVGITSLLPSLGHHASPHQRRKLYWGVRSQALVDAVRGVFGDDFGVGRGGEVHIEVGQRLDWKGILGREVKDGDGVEGAEVTVVCCGPPTMADEVRREVGRLARDGQGGVAVRFVERAFGW